ncbi:hypothetical protein [Nocardia sp. NPDC058633]|uniref:hypothetical protein n=1 Tax=Nocardia sp. NPDC058633 TaxID=3346568 RepID=UPI003665D658
MTVYLALTSAPGPDSASSSKSHFGESDDDCEICHRAEELFGVRVDGRPLASEDEARVGQVHLSGLQCSLPERG